MKFKIQSKIEQLSQVHIYLQTINIVNCIVHPRQRTFTDSDISIEQAQPGLSKVPRRWDLGHLIRPEGAVVLHQSGTVKCTKEKATIYLFKLILKT